jgi:3-hydroxyisobutyrate dehydrogenase-like beta-hydroxyacid dehydrogenase
MVGVGLLGSVLAEKLSQAGFEVWVYDKDPAKSESLSCPNLSIAHSAGEVASACQRIVMCLPDSNRVTEVLWGTARMADHLTTNSTIIDTTTGDPQDTTTTGARLSLEGKTYLDTTVVGSSAQVREGNATILVGATHQDFESNRDVYSAWSDRVFHTGPLGSAALTKLLVNQVLGLNRLALAECLALAMKINLNPEQLLTILKATPAYSRIMDNKGPKMIQGDFSPEARLSQHRKDVGLILELGRRAGIALPASKTHHEVLDAAVASG